MHRRVLLIVAALTALAFAAPSSSARRLPRNGVLAFASEQHSSEVMLANGDGTNVRRLTNDTEPSRWPELSPDGTRVAYAHRVGDHRWMIIISTLDKSEADLLPTEGYALQPTWSPDGMRIAYATGPSDRTKPLHLELYDLASGTATSLDAATAGQRPSWSPDGKLLSFACTDSAGTHLCVVGADGSNLHILSSRGGSDVTSSWSPDGRRLVFSADAGDSTDLYVASATGGALTDLTNTKDVDEDDPTWTANGIVFWNDGDEEGAAVIQPDGTGLHPIGLGDDLPIDVRASRDGRSLAFTTGAFTTHVIATVPAGGGATNYVTSGPTDGEPAWSPDGRTLAFRHRDGIATIRANGRGLRRITSTGSTPAWSPDGKQIAYTRFASGAPHAWIVDRNGRNAHAVAGAGSASIAGSWSPDGKRLAVIAIGANGKLGVYAVTLKTHTAKLLTSAIGTLSAAWSPDGKSIAYTSYGSNSAALDVFIVDVATRKNRQVTHLERSAAAGEILSVGWSPDGTRIVYSTAPFTQDVTESAAYSVRRDGSGTRTAIGSQLAPSSVSWQPRP